MCILVGLTSQKSGICPIYIIEFIAHIQNFPIHKVLGWSNIHLSKTRVVGIYLNTEGEKVSTKWETI